MDGSLQVSLGRVGLEFGLPISTGNCPTEAEGNVPCGQGCPGWGSNVPFLDDSGVVL